MENTKPTTTIADIAEHPPLVKQVKKESIWKRMYEVRWLYIFLLPAVLFTILFRYVPMYGVQIAFRDFFPGRGILESPWAGLKYFSAFLRSFQFERVMMNTVLLSVVELLFTFPLPIILAISLHYVSHRGLKKSAQLITYAPYFISTIVVAGILLVFLSPRTGPVNIVIKALGGTPIFFMGSAELFRPVYVGSSIWQFTGYNAIIYMAVLSTVSPELHESALIDGANKIKRILHVDFPVLLPTTSVLLVMRIGRTLRLGFEKAYAMQNSLNISASEIVQTYVYKTGLLQGQFSYAAAVGLFLNIINFVILLLANRAAKRITSYGLF